MRRSGFGWRPTCRKTIAWLVILPACLFITSHTRQACGQRVFGLDTSSATGRATPPSQTQWNNSFNDADGDGIAYKFAFVRSNHGIPATGGTDDSEFYTNISRGTTAAPGTSAQNSRMISSTRRSSNRLSQCRSSAAIWRREIVSIVHSAYAASGVTRIVQKW